MKKVRVRYAPSPTGYLHIGNARTALFNYLFARHNKGDFIIRIEDTDIERNIKGGVESQLHYLKWLNINWDEGPTKGGKYGPYFQLERLDIYKKYADDLLKRDLAYKEYREGSKNYAIRMRSPKNKKLKFTDLVRGELEFDSNEVEDWIIMKDNGIPTYNFAVVIDDHLMEITHVFRGEEHITNTPKQVMVYEAFGWEVPKFGHMTIIVNEQGKKLSKRDKDVMQFISQYEEKGYLPEALFNFITLLGWSPKGNKEILSSEEIINSFDIKRLTKAPSMFDVNKLAFINSKYIKKLSQEEFVNFCKPFLKKGKIKIKDDLWLNTLTKLFKNRMLYGEQIIDFYNEFFNKKYKLNNEHLTYLKQQNAIELIKLIEIGIKDSNFNDSNEINNILVEAGNKLNIKGKDLYMPIMVALMATTKAPNLPECLLLIGKKEILKRIKELKKSYGKDK